VSALRDECIERGNTAFRQKFSCDGEKDVRVIVAGFVRDDREDPFAGLDQIERPLDYFNLCNLCNRWINLQSETVCSAQN